ncbi:hypothetical protein Efla_002600 [Eimeria flavescens]
MARPSSRKVAAEKGDPQDGAKPASDRTQEVRREKEETKKAKSAGAHSRHSLYDLLGISKDASPREITAAYRRRALMCHPDKVRQRQKKGADASQAEGEAAEAVSVEEATKHFQQLQAAYHVLNDPKRRERYDRTGKSAPEVYPHLRNDWETGDDELAGKSYEEAYEFYRKKFQEVTEDAIEQFKRRYIGSAEEKEDIMDFVSKFNGDLTNFFEFIPLSDPSDFKRYSELLSTLLREKKIKETAAFKKSIRDFEGIADKYKKKFGKEKKQAGTKRKADKTDADLASLALAIRGNMSKREAATNQFLDELGKKYSKKSRKA